MKKIKKIIDLCFKKDACSPLSELFFLGGKVWIIVFQNLWTNSNLMKIEIYL